ncbi:MAG: hypothetical protein HYZ23_00355 [Chloroflexi bacterium]|nr:hypothetical protein [Chloroflexota bacterium]
MFDNLRDDAASSYEDEAKFQPAAGATTASSARPRSKRLLGMTAFQRFVVMFMLMIAVCVIGSMVLLLTGRIAF